MVVLKFETINSKNNIKTQNKQGYTVTYLPESNCLLLYGVLSTSDVYTFSLTKKEWSLIKTTGKKPSFRRFYAHYYHKGLNGLIIHGGQIIEKQKKIRSSDECYILFVDSWQWRKIFLQDGPGERQFHKYFSIDEQSDEIYLFGGFSKPYDSYLNDLWLFRNFESLSTRTNKHQVHGCSSRQVQTKGQAPSIYGYSVKVIEEKVMFIGGQSTRQKRYLQIFVLNMRGLMWQKLDIDNRVCPSLTFLSVYESGMESQRLYIMGGIVGESNRENEKCYALGLREMQIVEQEKSLVPQLLQHSCLITQSPLCIGSLQHSTQKPQQVQVHILYEQHSSPSISKHFQTEQLYKSSQNISIQQYLKAIKHEQLLSQQLLKKNHLLEELFKEIQRYIALLYTRYLNDDHILPSEEIQEHKRLNIDSCQLLKLNYIQNAQDLQNIIKQIKTLRADLGLIHEDFERCIETQIDQEQP